MTDSDARPLDVGAARDLLDELRDFVASHTANNPRRRALHARIASLASSLAALETERHRMRHALQQIAEWGSATPRDSQDAHYNLGRAGGLASAVLADPNQVAT